MPTCAFSASGQEFDHPELRSRDSHMETSGPPKFPWSLICPFAHVLATPAGRASLTILETPVLPPLNKNPRCKRRGISEERQYITPQAAGNKTPSDSTTKAPTTVLSRLNSMASRLAVYASQCRLPIHHARLAPGCRSSSTGRDFHPQRLP